MSYARDQLLKQYSSELRQKTLVKNGKTRELLIASGKLRETLREIAWQGRAAYEKIAPDYVHGFRPGRSAASNAAAHIGAVAALTMDLESFFDTLGARDGANITLAGLGVAWPALAHRSTSIRRLVATCAQGLSTSPVLSNYLCNQPDSRLKQLAELHGMRYTRYADDLTFSTSDPVVTAGDLWSLSDRVAAVVRAHKLTVNRSKTKIQTSKAGRLVITGVALGSSELIATRETRRKLRAAAHNKHRRAVAGLKQWADPQRIYERNCLKILNQKFAAQNQSN